MQILTDNYEGSLGNLLSTRFGIEVPEELSEVTIKLPEQASEIFQFIPPGLDDLIDLFSKQRRNYIKYANSIIDTIDKTPLVIDLGYSGTIQYHLAKLMNRRIDGLYYFTESNRKPETLGCKCNSILSRDKSILGDEISDHTLYLESILQAPYGQLLYFDQDDEDEEIYPVYCDKDAIPSEIFVMQEIGVLCSPLYDCFLLRNLWRGGLTGEI